jgi:hypothetical protein
MGIYPECLSVGQAFGADPCGCPVIPSRFPLTPPALPLFTLLPQSAGAAVARIVKAFKVQAFTFFLVTA